MYGIFIYIWMSLMVHVGKYAKDPEGKDNPNIQSNSTKIRHSSAPKQKTIPTQKFGLNNKVL